MGVTNGNRQGIRSVDLRFAGQLEHVHDHHLHLLFIGSASSHHSLLDLSGRVLGDLQAFFGAGNDSGPTGLPELSAESAFFAMNTFSMPMVTGP